MCNGNKMPKRSSIAFFVIFTARYVIQERNRSNVSSTAGVAKLWPANIFRPACLAKCEVQLSSFFFFFSLGYFD